MISLARDVLFVGALVFLSVAHAGPGDYYAGIDPSHPATLKAALHDLIKNHRSLSYSDIWGEFPKLDTERQDTPADCQDNTTLGDVYSSKCWKPSERCGNYRCGNA